MRGGGENSVFQLRELEGNMSLLITPQVPGLIYLSFSQVSFFCTASPPWEIFKNSFTVHEHETPIVRLFADLFKGKKIGTV